MSFRTQAITAVLSYLHVSGDDILISTMFDGHPLLPIVVVDAAGGVCTYHTIAMRQLPQISCGAKDSLLEVHFTPSQKIRWNPPTISAASPSQ